jgi:hypothetical protein
MPKDFEECVEQSKHAPPKGKQQAIVRTIKPSEKTYIHVCKDQDGKWHRGEVKDNKVGGAWKKGGAREKVELISYMRYNKNHSAILSPEEARKFRTIEAAHPSQSPADRRHRINFLRSCRQLSE